MGSEWPYLPLEELVEIHDAQRKPVKKADRKSGPYPYYGASGIADYVDDYLFDGEYVLLAEDGDNLRTQKTPIAFMARGKFWVNNHAHIFKAKEGSSDFICYALQVVDVSSYISGSTRPKITQGDMRKIKIPAPSVSTRNKIAGILKSFDDKIELNKKINQTLEKMAQAMFKSWFVDFDPVFDNLLEKHNNNLEKASAYLTQKGAEDLIPKLQQRHQIQQTSDYKPLPEHIKKEFPSDFQHYEDMGWIPEGWEVSTTNEEFDIYGGGTPSTKNPEFWDGGTINWTTPKDLSSNETKILLDTDRKITEEGLSKISSGLLPIDTVLMSSRAPVGYLALAKVPVAINQGYIALACNKSLTPAYTIHWLESVMEDIKGMAGGTTFSEISKKAFRTIKLLIPNNKVIEAFTGDAESIYEKIYLNSSSNKELSSIRGYLLPKLISGQVELE